MKNKIPFFLLLTIVILTVHACAFCGRQGVFHAAISIKFKTQSDDLQLGPLGDFNGNTSALYNEEEELIDTSFINLYLEDWNRDWIEDNVEYSRRYKLFLNRNVTDEEVIYLIDIVYMGTVDDCDVYNVHNIKFFFNDSLYYDNNFSSHFDITLN